MDRCAGFKTLAGGYPYRLTEHERGHMGLGIGITPDRPRLVMNHQRTRSTHVEERRNTDDQR